MSRVTVTMTVTDSDFLLAILFLGLGSMVMRVTRADDVTCFLVLHLLILRSVESRLPVWPVFHHCLGPLQPAVLWTFSHRQRQDFKQNTVYIDILRYLSLSLSLSLSLYIYIYI